MIRAASTFFSGWAGTIMAMSSSSKSTAGYSQKPLAQKLGLANGVNIVLNAPDGYEGALSLAKEVGLVSRLQPDADFIQAFYTRAIELENDF